MNYQVKENTKKEAVLEITVSKEDFELGLQEAYIKNKKHFAIPGFRKGKVPRKMVEQFYGESVLFEDAVNAVMPEKYEEALIDSKLDVVSKPEIDITSISVEEGFVFTAKVYLKPEVELSGYKGIKAQKTEYNVNDADVEREIETLKEKTVRLVDKEDQAIEPGDIANIDYEGFCDGVAFDGGKGEAFDLTIGSNQFIPGFEDQLIGKKAGEEVDVNVTFPEEYHAEELKGKAAIFKVKVNKVTFKEYSELNDEFAKDVSEFETFSELKADIEKKLADNADTRSKQEFENNVLEELLKLATVDIPDCMIEERIDTLVNDFDYRLKSQGMTMEKYMEYTGMNLADFRGQFKERAENQVKLSLTLAKVSELEKLSLTDEEVEAELQKMADSYKMELDQIKKFINLEDYKAELLSQKAVDFVMENAEPVKEEAEKTTTKKKAAPKKDDEQEEKPKKTTKTAKAKKEDDKKEE